MLMDEKINLLVLDEPTNHLDIDSREWLEDALEDYEGTLIFVSHDRYFVNKFATRIWELENGHIRDFPCGYENTVPSRKRRPSRLPRRKSPKRSARKNRRPPAVRCWKSKSVRWNVRLRKQEQLSAQLDTQIEAAASDYQELARLMAEKQSCERCAYRPDGRVGAAFV
ncbi:MAG: hypothetical protein ACLU3I_11135 [Acutalibacteraceae bacterium]